MTVTIVVLILLMISVSALKLVILFKLIEFGYRRWIRSDAAGHQDGRSRVGMILRERFASGEIDAEEMRRRSDVIATKYEPNKGRMS